MHLGILYSYYFFLLLFYHIYFFFHQSLFGFFICVDRCVSVCITIAYFVKLIWFFLFIFFLFFHFHISYQAIYTTNLNWILINTLKLQYFILILFFVCLFKFCDLVFFILVNRNLGGFQWKKEKISWAAVNLTPDFTF